MTGPTHSGRPPAPPGPPRFVRQFALTQGRTESIGPTLPIESLVIATPHTPYRLTAEQQAIRALCSTPHSIAEISSHLRVHLGIARVLVSDLVANGLATVTTGNYDTGPDLPTLERLLHDLERL
jgi:Protein of unknown function (DUF742)